MLSQFMYSFQEVALGTGKSHLIKTIYNAHQERVANWVKTLQLELEGSLFIPTRNLVGA